MPEKMMNQEQEQEMVSEPDEINRQEQHKDSSQELDQRLKMEEEHKEKLKKEPEQKHSTDVLELEFLEIAKETNDDMLKLETDEEREQEQETVDLLEQETLDLLEQETLDLVEQETMDLLELPEFIVRTVFLHLDGSSLHRCRQVCSSWNGVILSLWTSRSGRSSLSGRLRRCWSSSCPHLLPEVEVLTLPVSLDSHLLLLAVCQGAAVVRASRPHTGPGASLPSPGTSLSPIPGAWAPEAPSRSSPGVQEPVEYISLTVVEAGGPWEVGLAPKDPTEIFYRAEMTPVLVAAVTDLGAVAVWDRGSHKLLYCRRESVAECSLSLRASDCHVLLWNEHREEFLLLEHKEGEVREQARVHSRLADTYILDLAGPHFLTESRHGVHVWSLSSPTLPRHSLAMDTFGLELGCLIYPYCALTVATSVQSWQDGWTVQVWDCVAGVCLRTLPGAGYITDIRQTADRLLLCRKVRDVPCVVVYDLEDLCSSSPSPWHREIPLPAVCSKISVSPTSLFLTDFDSQSVILTTWNFWTSSH